MVNCSFLSRLAAMAYLPHCELVSFRHLASVLIASALATRATRASFHKTLMGQYMNPTISASLPILTVSATWMLLCSIVFFGRDFIDMKPGRFHCGGVRQRSNRREVMAVEH